VNVRLGEGNTPLVPSVTTPGVWFKLESCNPSGSYKDRFVAGEIERMLAIGAKACVATSSGNTGSALAAGAARYGLRSSIVVNEFAPAGKLAQMQAHGARVIRVPGFTVDAALTREVMETLALLAQEEGLPLVVSAYRYCPVGMARVERLGEEVVAALPGARIFVPVGGGGLATAVVRGVAGRAAVTAVQPAGCDTVVTTLASGAGVRPVTSTTRISGLAVPFDIDAGQAVEELRNSGGMAITVEDDEVFEAQRVMLRDEGIYAEPAGAAAFAGALKQLRHGHSAVPRPMVCLVTGHGFKDPDSIAGRISTSEERVDASRLRVVLLGTERVL